MSKILVTGSNGLLGQKLVEQLVRTEHDVIATSRSYNRINFSSNYIFELLDITNELEVNYLVEKYRPDVIINTAALTNVNQCEHSQDDCWRINVQGVDHLIHAANKFESHLVHLSTDFVFDGINGSYSEDDMVNPLSLYGRSKYESERNVRSKAQKWSIVRTILVYGVLPYKVRPTIVDWIKDSLENNKKIKVINDQFRMPTLVDDLAWACIKIGTLGKQGIYHISGNTMLSILEIANQVADFFLLDKSLISPISTIELNEIAKRPNRTGFVLEKAKNELNYFPHSFKEGLKVVKEQIDLLNN